jgi:ABC-type uncharacterized transport system involved in gliding motility auxiliary subunit
MSPSFIESFRAVRWLRTFNLVLQAILFLTFFGGLNYVAKNHAWKRFDLTKHRKFSLSPETLSYAKNLQRPVHIILTVSPDTDNPEVRGLLDEYVYATEDRPAARISKELLDVYQSRRRAEELGIEQADVLVLLSGGKARIVRVDDLYTLKNKKRELFRGEQVLTAAILEVASPVRQKIYFVSGHGELQLNSTDPHSGLSNLRDQLKLRNFDVDTLELPITRKLPADASLLVIVAPKSKYAAAEQELLRQYLGANAGRMLIFLEPGKTTSALGLDELLLDWGVLVHNDLVLDTGPENITDNLELLIRWFAANHPITKALADYGGLALRLGMTRSVFPDPGRTLGSGLNTTALVVTSKTAWGERGGQQPNEIRYDPGIDTGPNPLMEPQDRLGIVVASERLAARDNLPFSVPGGKIVVFGSGDMVANGRLDNASLLLALNSVNWTVDRDRQLNVPPRPVERFQLAISAADFMRLRYALLLVLPGATLLLGLLVYWTRRA